MEPLDLRLRPPRSPRERLDGLVLLPRTIDKFRSQLPGGNTSAYITDRGVTKFMLDMIRVSETDLREVVARATNDAEVAAWLREHADTSRYEKTNRILENLVVEQVAEDLRELFEQFYAGRDPALTNVFDIIEWDDRRSYDPAHR